MMQRVYTRSLSALGQIARYGRAMSSSQKIPGEVQAPSAVDPVYYEAPSIKHLPPDLLRYGLTIGDVEEAVRESLAKDLGIASPDPVTVNEIVESMKEMLSLKNAGQPEINTAVKQMVMKRFEKRRYDTGSTEVQVAALTTRITYLRMHFRRNKKDVHSKRGMIALVSRRNGLLAYLKRKDYFSYQNVVKTLGLRDAAKELD